MGVWFGCLSLMHCPLLFFSYYNLQDLFMRKVRQFTFQIKNLFGTSKPFSCDVEIRHADQLTVLPIEVM